MLSAMAPTPAAAAPFGDPDDTPLLSIVVVRFAGGKHIHAVLTALRTDLETRRDVEIVVAQHDDALPLEPAPNVRCVCLPTDQGPASLRAHGVRQARGTYVAVTEDHCVPASGWSAAVIESHQAGHDVVGGPIAPAPSLRGVDLALYLLAYGRYQPPQTARAVPSLSDCNVSYARHRLSEVGSVWAETFVESDVHAALLARGVQLWMVPGAVVTQARKVDLPALLEEQRIHGAEFARGRGARTSGARRRVLQAGTLVLPVLMTWRAFRSARGLDPWRLLSALPGLLRLALAWSRGEREGYRRPAVNT